MTTTTIARTVPAVVGVLVRSLLSSAPLLVAVAVAAAVGAENARMTAGAPKTMRLGRSGKLGTKKEALLTWQV